MKITNRKAIDVQKALGSLMPLNLTMKASMEIALLADSVEKQVFACAKVRDQLIKNYKIKIGLGDKEGEVKFSSTIDGKDDAETLSLREKALNEFVDKINELMETEGNDIEYRIQLPDMNIQPDVLKPLIGFLK